MIVGNEYVITWKGYGDVFLAKLESITETTYVFTNKLETGIIYKSSVEDGKVKIQRVMEVSA